MSVQCARHKRTETNTKRCQNEATHIYEYLRMPLCDPCTRVIRKDMKRGGHDDTQLIASLSDYTGKLYDGTQFVNGAITVYGRDRA